MRSRFRLAQLQRTLTNQHQRAVLRNSTGNTQPSSGNAARRSRKAETVFRPEEERAVLRSASPKLRSDLFVLSIWRPTEASSAGPRRRVPRGGLVLPAGKGCGGRVQTLGGLHDQRGPPTVELVDEDDLDAVRISGNVEVRLRHRYLLGLHNAHLDRPLLRRDTSDVCDHALRGRRGTQLPRPVLHHRNLLYRLVHPGSPRSLRHLSQQTHFLEGLQEPGRYHGHIALLRHSLQRPVDHELRRSQVQRVASVSQGHPTDSNLQTDQTLGRPTGAHTDLQGEPRRSRTFSRRAMRLPASLLQRHLLRGTRHQRHADTQHSGRVLVGHHHHDNGRIRGQGSGWESWEGRRCRLRHNRSPHSSHSGPDHYRTF